MLMSGHHDQTIWEIRVYSCGRLGQEGEVRTRRGRAFSHPRARAWADRDAERLPGNATALEQFAKPKGREGAPVRLKRVTETPSAEAAD